MVRKRYTPEQIIGKLREAEILLSHDATTGLLFGGQVKPKKSFDIG